MWPKSRRENAGGAYADHHHTPEESAPSHIGRFRLEDQVLGDALYEAVMQVLRTRLEAARAGNGR